MVDSRKLSKEEDKEIMKGLNLDKEGLKAIKKKISTCYSMETFMS